MTDPTGTPLPQIEGNVVHAGDRFKPKTRRKRTARSERKELTMPRVLAFKVTGKDYIERCIRPGFCVQITAAGSKSWGVEAKVLRGKQRRVIFAPIAGGKAMKIEEARAIAQKLYTDATVHGIDIAKSAQEVEGELTLPQAHELFINFPGKSFSADTKKQYGHRLDRLMAVLPKGNMWDYTKQQIDAAYVKLCENAQRTRGGETTAGTSSAYCAIKYFTTLWNFHSRKLDRPRKCPAECLKGVMKSPGKRDVDIEDQHFALFWKALDEIVIGSGLQAAAVVWALYFRMLVLTACRRTELLGLKWTDIDLNMKTPQVFIPKTRTKPKKDHRFPIGPWLAKQLRAHKKSQEVTDPETGAVTSTEWVFAYPLGCAYCAGLPMSTSAATRVWNQVRKRIGVRYNPHDTRRTHITTAAGCGVDWLIAAKLANQVVPGQTAAYAQIKVEMMRPHQNAIEAKMLKLARSK